MRTFTNFTFRISKQASKTAEKEPWLVCEVLYIQSLTATT